MQRVQNNATTKSNALGLSASLPDDVLLEMLSTVEPGSLAQLLRADKPLRDLYEKNKEQVFRQRLIKEYGVSSYEECYKLLNHLQTLDSQGLFELYRLRQQDCKQITAYIAKTIGMFQGLASREQKLAYGKAMLSRVATCLPSMLQDKSDHNTIRAAHKLIENFTKDIEEKEVSPKAKADWEEFKAVYQPIFAKAMMQVDAMNGGKKKRAAPKKKVAPKKK